ncbi:unnamed protein product [Adineta steineri]|uniref:AmmeMemoRadiSam system protein B n=1 Tax=Adineta steineri TaxID=433720 RepID=A0A815GFN5_9BILA|nr:unnamed protein product [Adineta steineri]CAF1339832.1 unnamed protein product [Adineta steineri]CAF1592284.1 unnamed protein product [Adineta steineri]CAF1592462.1 unnamed protein product [Adineta steineri]
MIRKPLCYYYSSLKSECLQEIVSSYLHRLGPGQLPLELSTINNNDTTFIPCLLVPHGAYCDSGPLYAKAYYWLNSFIFDTVLIIGTNHSGAGLSNVSLSPDNWQTPLGVVETDADLFNIFVSILGIQYVDREAHRNEHSIENQLPFLKHIRPNAKLIALSLSRLNDLNKGYQICEQIKKAIDLYQQQTGKRIVIISTTDYTHYGPGYGQNNAQNLSANEEYARVNNKSILQSILSNNPEQLLQTQQITQNSMCGLWPSLIIMILSRLLNNNKGLWNVLSYNVSSEVMKRGKDVCGFASLIYSNTV